MRNGGSHIPWGDPEGPEPGQTSAGTRWLRLSEISPILLRSAGIAGVAAGIMVVVSNGIWTSDPRSTEARAPATEVAIRDMAEEPAVVAAAEPEGGALVIDSVAAEPAPERFVAALPEASTPETVEVEPIAPVVALPAPDLLAALPVPAEIQPVAEAAALITESEPAPAVVTPDPVIGQSATPAAEPLAVVPEPVAVAPAPAAPTAEQEQAAGSEPDAEAFRRAREALAAAAAAAAETRPQAAETGPQIAEPELASEQAQSAGSRPDDEALRRAREALAAAAAPEPIAATPEPAAAAPEAAPAASETAAAQPATDQAEAAGSAPDAAALARARQAVALAAAAAAGETGAQAAEIRPQVAPLPQVAVSGDAGAEEPSPFTQHAVECPRDWVAGDQAAETPPGCQTLAALIPSDIVAEEEEALIAAAEEHAATMPRAPRARPDPGPNPIREQRTTRTARADSSWPSEPPPNCGSKHARWRFVDEARTQKEWYCR